MMKRKIFTLLAEQHLAAGGTGLLCGQIPRRKITLGILFTAVEYRLILAVLHHNLACALGARNVQLLGLLLGKSTSGILRASKEGAEFSRTLYHVRSADLALEIRNNGSLLFFLLLCLDRFLLRRCRQGR